MARKKIGLIGAGNIGGELANLLVGVATHSTAQSALSKSRAWLAQHPPERWETQWDASARNVLLAQGR